jgi:hypothetical protein
MYTVHCHSNVVIPGNAHIPNGSSHPTPDKSNLKKSKITNTII